MKKVTKERKKKSLGTARSSAKVVASRAASSKATSRATSSRATTPPPSAGATSRQASVGDEEDDTPSHIGGVLNASSNTILIDVDMEETSNEEGDEDDEAKLSELCYSIVNISFEL